MKDYLEEFNALPEKYGWRVIKDPETGILVGINDELNITTQGKDRLEIVENIIECLDLLTNSYKKDLDKIYKKEKTYDFFTILFALWFGSSCLLTSAFKWFNLDVNWFNLDVNFLITAPIALAISYLLAKKLQKKSK